MTMTNASFGPALQGILDSYGTNTYKLTASTAGAVNIRFEHPAGPGTKGTAFRLQLVDFLGNVLVDTIATGNVAFDTTVAAAGDYYLKLIDPTTGGEAPGLYTVTAALFGTVGTVYDGGANNNTATAISVAPGAPVVGSLTSGDADVFKLKATAGGVVTLDFIHPNGVGTSGNAITLALSDAAGNVVVQTTTNGNIVLTSTVAAAGDYYVKVSDGGIYESGDGGLYTLTTRIAGAPATTFDGAANNTTASALATTMGTPIVGSLNANDADLFKLRADSGGVVTLDFTHPEGAGKNGNAITLELTDAAGNMVVKTTTNGNTVFSTTVAAAGDYYVKVSDGGIYESGDGGIYQLTPTLAAVAGTTYDGAANNSTVTAIATTFGATIAGSLNASDADFFKLHADAGGVIKLDFVHPNGAGNDGNAITIELLDAAGNVAIRTTTNGNTALVTSVTAAGDYYVKVADGGIYESGDGGIYKLTTSISSLDSVAYDGAANNNSATAVKAPLGAAIIGSLNNADSDFFSFSTAAGGTLSVNLVHPEGAGTSGADIMLTILDANSGTVLAKSFSGNGLFTTSLAAAGDYTLKVSDPSIYSHDDGGIYTIMAGLASKAGATLDGTSLADSLAGSGGNDVINGAGGFDTVTYLGDAANYRIAISAAGVSVIDSSGKDGADTLFNVERLQFADQVVSLETNGVAAQAYRVYQAAFDRTPDPIGLGYWIMNMEKGTSLVAVAQAFIGSQEFHDAYGANPAHSDMVAKFYTNVLHRAPDQAGLDFWTQALDSGSVDAATVLAGFSESAENVAQLTGTISHGIGYQAYTAF